MGHAYWSSSSFLPNIIKICLKVSKLWSAQDFGFRGDNYVMKKVRVVSLACDTPSGPLLHFYKTLSKYVFGYQSYGVHKSLVSGEITTWRRKKWELSLLHVTCLLVLLFISTKYYHIISNSMGVMACTRFRLQGRQLHNEESELSLLHTTSLLVRLFISTKYYQNMSKDIKVMEYTRLRLKDFCFREDNYIAKWELSLLHPTRLLVLLFILTKYYHIT